MSIQFEVMSGYFVLLGLCYNNIAIEIVEVTLGKKKQNKPPQCWQPVASAVSGTAINWFKPNFHPISIQFPQSVISHRLNTADLLEDSINESPIPIILHFAWGHTTL